VEIELHPGLPDGLNTAFEDGSFLGIWLARHYLEKTQDNRDEHHRKGKQDGYDEKQRY
jgi:hypothetical protein